MGPPAQYRPPGMAAEVPGEGRSKAQLIVGIDFVSITTSQARVAQSLINKGHYLFRCRIRLCYQHRGEGGHHYRMAWRGKPDKAKGLLAYISH